MGEQRVVGWVRVGGVAARVGDQAQVLVVRLGGGLVCVWRGVGVRVRGVGCSSGQGEGACRAGGAWGWGASEVGDLVGALGLGCCRQGSRLCCWRCRGAGPHAS